MLYEGRFGIRKGRSTYMGVSVVVDKITKVLDKHSVPLHQGIQGIQESSKDTCV